MEIWGIVATAILGAGLLAAVWGIAIERQLFVVREQELGILPEGSKPLKVLHISDFHLAPWQRRKINFIRSLGELEPDLVISTGDILGHPDSVPTAARAMSRLLNFPGFFVNGSNDYFAPVLRNPLAYLAKPSERSDGEKLDTEKLLKSFRKAGWHNLNNDVSNQRIKGLRIGFMGVDDAHDDRDNLETVAERSRLIDNCDLMIGITHAPYMRVIESMTANGAQLIFAGHTHGGQVRLPVIGALTTNCDLPNKFARGTSAWQFEGKQSILNVCAGLGHSIFAPVRFFCRPEVRLLTLVAKAS